MIGLETQIQLLVGSLLFGFAFCCIYSVFNYIFYHKPKVIRFIVELPLFILATIFYFFLNYKISDGLLNIYYGLFILLGVIIYQKFYAAKFIKLCSRVDKFLDKHLYSKIRLKIFKIHVIIKSKLRKRKNEKKRITKPNALEQKPRDDNAITWNIPSSFGVHD